jgi:hypothetical protein
MSDALIRAQIKVILAAVSDIGEVHDYFRYRKSWADWLDLMTNTSGSPSVTRINGWMFDREYMVTSDDDIPVGMIEYVHHYNFLGVYEIDDAAGSSKDFQTLLDGICTAFKSNRKLNGTADRHDFMQINAVGIDEYGEVSYHYAGLSLTVHERVSK